MNPPFHPYAAFGSPADLCRRFGRPRRKVNPWSLLACAASPLILGFFRRTRRVTTNPEPTP